MIDVRAIVLTLGLAAGCSFSVDAAPGDGAPDVSLDGAPDAPEPFTCVPWTALDVDPCGATLTTPITLVLRVGSHVVDGDAGTLATNGGSPTPLPGGIVVQAGGPMVRVISARSLRIDAGAMVRITGSRPVIFVVHGDALIDGVLDVSARVDSAGSTSTPGPGGNDPTLCASATGGAGQSSSGTGGGGGGAGGAYGGDGGDGGDGQGSGHGAKGTKGAKTSDPLLVPLRGGCAGGKGGDDSVGAIDEGGRAGDGGGALEITARGTIVIGGSVMANGSSGAAGGGITPVRAGGGGGGAGGALLLDGETITLRPTATLCANGGGGGEGGQLASTSSPGAAPTCTTARALGGAIQPDAGDGGDGGAGAGVNATGATNGASNAGGGGGGGGAGRTRFRGRAQAATIDAAATVSPLPGA